MDVFTSSVVYSTANPVVVYLAGDDQTLMPNSDLAYQQSVVFVVVNVRQGVLGFLSHSSLSGMNSPFRVSYYHIFRTDSRKRCLDNFNSRDPYTYYD